MSGKTRKLLLRICSFAVVIFMLVGEIKVPVYAEEIDIDIAEEVVTEVSAEEEGEIDLIDESILASDEEFVEEDFEEAEFEDVTGGLSLMDEGSGAIEGIDIRDNMYMYSGRSLRPEVLFMPEGTSQTEYKLSSGDENVVRITKDDDENETIIEAVAPGEATITVTSLNNEEIKDSMVVTVLTMLENGEAFERTEQENWCEDYFTEIHPNGKNNRTTQLTVTDNSEGTETGLPISWVSENSSVATVDATGKVTILNTVNTDSQAWIRATVGGDGYDYCLTFRCCIDILMPELKATSLIASPKDLYLDINNEEDNTGEIWEDTGMEDPENPGENIWEYRYSRGVNIMPLIYKPANANRFPDVTITSSNEDVARVTRENTVYACGLGTAVITVVENESGNVTNLKVKVLGIKESYVELKPGETCELKLSDGTDTEYKASWKAENTSAVSIDANGKVTAKMGGGSENYSGIYAIFNGKEFRSGVKVLTEIKSLTAISQKSGTDKAVLEVWPTDDDHGYRNNEDNIELISDPAGLVNTDDNPEWRNTEFIIPEGMEKYLEINNWGEVRAYYDEELLTYGGSIDIPVTIKTTTYDYHHWVEDDPETHSGHDEKWAFSSAEATITYTVAISDYIYEDPDWDSTKTCVLKGTKELTYDDLDGGLRDAGWRFSPDDLDKSIEDLKSSKLDITRFDGMNWGKIAIYRKGLSGDIQQSQIGIEFISNPDLFAWICSIAESSLPYYTSDLKDEDYAKADIGYDINWFADGRFIENYDVKIDPEDESAHEYSFKVDSEISRPLKSKDVLEELIVDEHKWYRAKAVGTGYIDVTLTVFETANPENVLTEVTSTITVTTFKGAGKGAIDWYGGDVSTNVVKVTDVKKPYDNIDLRNGLDVYYAPEDPIFDPEAPEYDSDAEYKEYYSDYCDSSEGWLHYLTVGKTYDVVIKNETPFSLSVKSSDTGVLKTGGAKAVNEVIDSDGNKATGNYIVVPVTVLKSGFADIVTTASDDFKQSGIITVMAKDPLTNDADAVITMDTKAFTINKTLRKEYQAIETFVKHSFGSSDGAPYDLCLVNAYLDSDTEDNRIDIYWTGKGGDYIGVNGSAGKHKLHLEYGRYGKVEFLEEGKLFEFDEETGDFRRTETGDLIPWSEDRDGIHGEPYLDASDLQVTKTQTFDITIKEANKAPSLTVKQLNTLNTSYQNVFRVWEDYIPEENEHIDKMYDMNDKAGVFIITAGTEPIYDLKVYDDNGEMQGGDRDRHMGDYSFDYGQGYLYLYKEPKGKIKIVADTERYEGLVKDKVAVKTENDDKAYVLSSTSGTIFTDSGEFGVFNAYDTRITLQILDKKTKKPINLNSLVDDRDDIPSAEPLKTVITCKTVSGNMKNDYYVNRDGDRLTLQGYYYDEERGKDRLYDETLPGEADNAYNSAPDAKKGDVVEISVKLPEWTKPITFKYIIKGISTAKASLALGEKTLTLYNYKGSNNSVETSISYGGCTSWLLNDIAIYEEVGKGKTQVLNDKLRAWIDSNAGRVVVATNNATKGELPNGTYTLKLEANGDWKKKPNATLKIKVVNVDPGSDAKGDGVKVTATVKGTIDVLDRDGTGLTITPKFTNLPKNAEIEFRGITGPDASKFYEAGQKDGVITLKLNHDDLIIKGADYNIKLNYYVRTDSQGHALLFDPLDVTLSSKCFKQGGTKSEVIWNSVFSKNEGYEPREVNIRMTNSAGNNLWIGHVEMDESNGFHRDYDNYDGFSIVHEHTSDSVGGKTYPLKLYVYLNEAFVNEKPITITVKATLAK